MASRPEDSKIEYATTQLGGSGSSDTSQPWSRPTFEMDAILGGRYRVVRFLARGGMGEVYEAEDLTLKMRVALKCIAAEVAADEGALDRLKQEVLLARKVTHPNVCRLHDLGFHTGEHGTIAFLTMDLLKGDTLAAHIARKGRLEPREALPLVKQMAAALTAAHAAGVIHRDLKARNVMLASSADTSTPRAMVMDFGIATSAEGEERSAVDTGGRFAGTPAYMAPEQVSGGTITPRTDLYALGVVMFEMVTGTLPFRSDKALEVVTMRLTHPPPPPRERVPSLDKTWNDVILKCLAREPEGRFASAEEMVAALEAGTQKPPRTSRVWIGAAVLALAVAGALVAKGRGLGDASDALGGAPIGVNDGTHRLALAVLPLRGAAKQDEGNAWLSTAVADMLATELSVGEHVNVVAEARVASARRDLGVEDAHDGATLARLRENLGAEYVVDGTYTVSPDASLRVDLTLRDAKTGKTVRKLASTGTTAKVFEVAAQAGASLRETLGVRQPTGAQAGEARAATSQSPDAARAYAEGMAKLRAYDYAGARAALERATAADPSFALAHDGLAQTWEALHADPKMLDEAKKAFESSRGLSREEQLRIEARYRAASKEWDRAISIDRTLFGFFPDSVDYGLALARDSIAGGHPNDALAVTDALHALPAPAGMDPRIDCAEASASGKISDSKRRLAAAQRCAERAKQIGATRTEGQALTEEAEVDYATGAMEEGDRAFEEARALFDKIGDAEARARVLQGEADHLWKTGQSARAIPLLQQTVPIYRSLGNQFMLGNALNLLANASFMVGDDATARVSWEEARGVFEAAGDREGVGHTTGNIAVAFENEGELVRAREGYRDAIERLRAVGSREGEYQQTWNLSEVLLAAGDVTQSKQVADQAEKLVSALDMKEALGGMRQIRAKIARAEGDFAACLKECDDADAILATSNSATWIAETDTERAAALLDLRRAREAETTARTAADALRTQGEKSSEALARAVLANALVDQGKLDDARKAIADADAARASKYAVLLAIDLARAGLLAKSGDADGATRLFDDVRARADAKSFGAEALEARIALARLGPEEARVAALHAIAAEARAKGLLRLAKLAR